MYLQFFQNAHTHPFFSHKQVIMVKTLESLYLCYAVCARYGSLNVVTKKTYIVTVAECF